MTAPRDLVAAAADELYGLEPGGFVARRDELVREARAVRDREAAAAIKALRRPTLGAWYVNVAARARLTALHDLLRLGRDLRAAQADADVPLLRDLAGRRGALERRVLADLTAHLAELGVTAAPAALEEVRTTLAAALADPDAEAAVLAGRLDRPLVYGGFGGGGFGGEGFGGGTNASGSGAAPSGGVAVAKAEAEARRAAEAAVKAARVRHTRAVTAADRAAAVLAEVIDQLAEVADQVAKLERRRDDLAREAAATQAELEAAEAQVTAAEQRLSPGRPGPRRWSAT